MNAANGAQAKPKPAVEMLDRATATMWAKWFDALGDPTRVLILHLLAAEGRPLTVGEITERLDVGQSTVSHHLAKLTDTCFVLVERIGTSSLFRVNQACIDSFPSAADMVMGRINDSFADVVTNQP